MRKFYEIKLYDFAWNFKKQVNTQRLSSDIIYSENINGVQGNLVLEISWESSDYSVSDIIEVREINLDLKKTFFLNLDLTNINSFYTMPNNSFFTGGVFPTYTGIIERINSKEYQFTEKITLDVFWIWTALNDIIYKNGTTKKFTKNDTLWNIAIDIIDYFNWQYGAITETQNLWTSLLWYDDIDISWDSVNIEFENENCYEALSKLTKDTDFYFFIDATGKVTFKQTGENKILTFEREIINIEKKAKKDDMVNKYYLARAWGSWSEEIYENTSSQNTYNLKEKYESRTDIQNNTTQDLIWDTRVADFWAPRIETFVKIKPQISNTIYPWMTITTQNTRNPITNTQITKIDKRRDEWTLYLWDFTSFGKVILQRK